MSNHSFLFMLCLMKGGKSLVEAHYPPVFIEFTKEKKA